MMPNNRQLLILIILFELLVITSATWKAHRQEYDRERRQKARQWSNAVNNLRTIVKKGHDNHLRNKVDDSDVIDRKRNSPMWARKWPGGVVPFEIAPGFSDERQATMRAATRGITEATNDCIKYVPRNRNDSNWIVIRRGFE